jgi:hypothetical protein
MTITHRFLSWDAVQLSDSHKSLASLLRSDVPILRPAEDMIELQFVAKLLRVFAFLSVEENTPETYLYTDWLN